MKLELCPALPTEIADLLVDYWGSRANILIGSSYGIGLTDLGTYQIHQSQS